MDGQVINLVNAIVEHEWKEEDQEKVFNVVGKIVEMSRSGKLPEGFKLKSINVIGDQRRAICNWDAPSITALRELVDSVNPPTDRRITEAMRIL